MRRASDSPRKRRSTSATSAGSRQPTRARRSDLPERRTARADALCVAVLRDRMGLHAEIDLGLADKVAEEGHCLRGEHVIPFVSTSPGDGIRRQAGAEQLMDHLHARCLASDTSPSNGTPSSPGCRRSSTIERTWLHAPGRLCRRRSSDPALARNVGERTTSAAPGVGPPAAGSAPCAVAALERQRLDPRRLPRLPLYTCAHHAECRDARLRRCAPHSLCCPPNRQAGTHCRCASVGLCGAEAVLYHRRCWCSSRRPAKTVQRESGRSRSDGPTPNLSCPRNGKRTARPDRPAGS